MRRSISFAFVSVVCCSLISLASTIAGSDELADSQSLSTKSQLDKEAALNDISRIRKQLGGSVLKGSILAPDATNESFDSKLRRELGLPGKPKPSSPVATRSTANMVKSLRTHCAKLDEIANQIETLREYTHADALRESAADLRLIARQLDADQPAKQRK